MSILAGVAPEHPVIRGIRSSETPGVTCAAVVDCATETDESQGRVVHVRLRNILLVVVAAGLALAGTGPASAASPQVTCGAYLEEDAHLTRDLRCPDGNGISLALDVTLDLRGHRLIGPGAGSDAGSGIGVRLSPAWPSQVVNGTIRDWPVGIGGNEDFETVEYATLRDLKLLGNGTAVLANQAVLTAERVTVRRNALGIHARSWGERGTDLSVTDSSFRDNTVAVEVDARSRVELRDSVFRQNDVGYTVTPGEPDGYEALLEGNTFLRNRDAIHVTVPGTGLRENSARRNSGWGIYAPGAIDLGGNISRRNGNQPQCVGVAC